MPEWSIMALDIFMYVMWHISRDQAEHCRKMAYGSLSAKIGILLTS